MECSLLSLEDAGFEIPPGVDLSGCLRNGERECFSCVCVYVCVCVCVCVCDREREREREGNRQTQTHRETDRQRKCVRASDAYRTSNKPRNIKIMVSC